MALISLRDLLFLCLCGILHFVYRHHRKPVAPLPPTLPGWPIIGNTFQIPLVRVHNFYKELGQRLGSKIVFLEALGKPMLIINDQNIAKDLLEKRSGLYSSRPSMPMFTDVMRLDAFFSVMPYGDQWRNHRRIFQQYFSKGALHRKQKKVLEFVRKALLPNLYEDPEHFYDHVRECIGGLTLVMTYGLPVQRTRDPLIKMAEQCFTACLRAAAPGTYLVNVLPSLKYMPGWIPGVTFKKEGAKLREQLLRLIEEPYDTTLKSLHDGTASESFVFESEERFKDMPLQREEVKYIATQVFGAASETTVASTMTFILAMLIHPDIQRKAQKEVDFIIGLERLPDFSDQTHLPYLTAILKEVLRWNPVVPMGVPHMTTEEDVYEGYYIPKGCTVFANAYAMLHDDETFPNPTEFNPDRFIKDNTLLSDIPDPNSYATFGFGRRICPGSHIAMSTLYLIAASILALFDISPALDAEGSPIVPTPEFAVSSLVSEPLPFKCKLTPRQGLNIESLLQGCLGFDIIQ